MITINGTDLNQGQEICLIAALNSFRADLETNGLGDHEEGIKMKKAYINTLNQILMLLETYPD